MSMFEDPTTGGQGISIRHLDGNVIVALVTGYDPNAKYQDELKPSVTFNALIIGSGELHFGGSIPEGRPDNMRVKLPFYAENIIASNANIVRALASKAGTGRLTIGRIGRGQGTKGQPPWNLFSLDMKVPADAAARTLAEQLWTSHASGSMVNPEPYDVMAGPAAGPAVGVVPAAQQAMTDPWQNTEAAPANNWPSAYTKPASVDAVVWSGMDEATRAVVAAAAAPATVTAPAVPQAPPGVDQARWVAMSDEQRRQIAAALGGSL